MFTIFTDTNTPQKDQRATLKLYLKDGHNLAKNTSYLIEHRVMAETSGRYPQIYIRDYIMGIDNDRVRVFDAPAYMCYTGSLSVPYNTEYKEPGYSTYRQWVMSNAYNNVYIDWNTNELHVNYVYETTEDIRSYDRTQFVQLFPEKLKSVLAPRNGVYAKFNHVYKRGDLAWGDDKGILFTDLNSFTEPKNGISGYRLRIPKNISNYTHPWTWVKEITSANGSDLSASNGRYMAYSKTHGPIANHIVFYIDPDKFMKTFDNLDDLKFESFFVTIDDGENQGGILKNSENINSLAITKNMTKSPQINDIYTDDTVIKGDTGYNNADSKVFVTAKNFKDLAKSKTQLVNSDGKIEFYPANFDGVFDNMLKDDKLSFETIYRYANYYKSKPTIEKVKARIIFDKYDGTKDLAVTVPSSDKFRGEPGYVENGLGADNMPADPAKREGYIFRGWSTKKTPAAEFAKAETLTKVDQWNEGKAYKFDGTVPVNKTYRVYPVWEQELKGFTIVLHSNDGTDREERIKIAYDEKLPSKALMEAFTSQDEQNAEVGKSEYSKLATLPNAYDVNDGKEIGIFGYRDGYNLVGWSTDANNGNVKIEDLFSNSGILAREGQGKTAKYYLATVRTKAQGIGQAAAAKLFNEISPDAKNEVHLYAAWKPYFNIEITKQWYDSTSDKFKDKTVKEILQLLAHGKQDETPAQNPSLAEPIQIGLLYRTAVTEANDPTITGEANYYLVKGSLQKLEKNGGPLKWTLPSYDRYGKRLSYIAVEFEDTPEGTARYNAFGQKWTNIWATVADNLHKKPGEVWDNTSISKVQSLIIPKGNGEVDAFSGATVRKLYENGTAITETQANNSTVGTTPAYKTTFYNLKVKLANPTFLKMYEGDKVVRLKAPDDPRVQVVEFDLPEVDGKIIFKRDANEKTKWNRVVKNSKNTWDAFDKTDYTLVEKEHNGEKVLELKLDLEGKNQYKYLKAGQDVAATYYFLTQNDKSGTTVEKVNAKIDAPFIEGLRQDVLEEIDGEEYVVIRAPKPTLELGQLQAGAVVKLIDASIKKGEENEKAYKNLDGSPVIAEEIGGEYVFKVPKKANPSLVHETSVAAYVEQEGFNPTRTKVPCKVDLKGPDITAPELTIYTDEAVYKAEAVTTDEDAILASSADLGDGLLLEHDFATILGRKWNISGKTGPNKATKTVKLSMKDKFGNKSDKDWTINIVDRPRTENNIDAVQIPNEINKDYSVYTHKIQVKSAIKGATIKVYLEEPTNETVKAVISEKLLSTEQEIKITQGIGTNIKDKVWITQTEEGKKESVAKEVTMDVKGPNVPQVESLAPGQGTLTLTGITDDTRKIFISIAGRNITLTRDAEHDELWRNNSNYPFEMKGDNITISLDKNTRPDDSLRVVALDKYLNPMSDTKLIEDYKAPSMPTIVAENKGNGYTTVTGTSKNPGATVTIYEVKDVTDPNTGEVTVKRTFKGTAVVDDDGKYTAYIVPEEKVGTELGAVVTENGKESPMAKTTVTENAGIIPFDPNDPTPNPDDKRYVTVKLDANGGQFTKGTKSSFYVLNTYEVKVSDFDKALLGLEAPANKAFDKWTEDAEGKTAFTGRTFDKDETIYASYKANDNVIPFDPTNPIPNPDANKYVTVSLDANGGEFAQGTKSSFYVKKTYTMTTNDFAIAEKGLTPPQDKAFNAWALDKEGTKAFPAAGKKFDADASVFAQYREGRDVIPGTGNDKPEGYVTVTFKANAEQAALEGETTYYVNPKGNVKLGGILAPTIKEKTGYKVDYPAWSYTDNLNSASIVEKDITATARLYAKDKVIPVQDELGQKKPDGYFDVKFLAGDKGKLEGTSHYFVKPGTESKDVPTPNIIPNVGYEAKTGGDAWSPKIHTKFDDHFETTAQYNELDPISDKPQAGYVMVQFDGGDHGKLGTDKKSIIFVNPNKEIALNDKAPTVKEDINWSFDKWTIDSKEVDLTTPTKYAKDTVIKATYISDFSSESKDGFVLVEFKAGDKGVIAGGDTMIYVKQDKKVDLAAKAPKIKANVGYVHIGWNRDLVTIFTEPAVITAKYEEDDSISTKPIAGYSHIEFIDNTYVTIAKGAVKEYWVNPDKVVSVPAPDVVVEAGYMHIGWSENLTQQFKTDKKIKPISMASTDVVTKEIESYQEIEFLAGNHGQLVGLSGKTTYSVWVNPDKVVTIQGPEIKANTGKRFIGWLKQGDSKANMVKSGQAIKGQFKKLSPKQAVQYTAQYDDIEDVTDKYEDGYVAVKFIAGANAKFTKPNQDKNIVTYYVNPDKKLRLGQVLSSKHPEPDLVYEAGYEKGNTKWDPDLVKEVTVTEELQYTANVKSKGKVDSNDTPKPKNWKTVEFRIFDYDKDVAEITDGISTYLVDPNEEVTLEAPDVAITKKGYSLDGWNHKLTAKFEQDTVIYALIGGDISTKPKDGFVKVSFAPGENGKFEEGASTEVYIRKDTEVDLGARAPKVRANKNYSHSGWTFDGKQYGINSIKTSFSEEENIITATYNQDIIDNPNTPQPPAGYARVMFKRGTNGKFKTGSKANFDVRIDANLTIGDLDKPEVIPNDGYFFIKWDTSDDTKITKSMNVTAEYSSDIIPGNDPNKPVQPGFVRITFNPDLNGTFANRDDAKFYDVRENAGKKLSDLKKPAIKAFDGYTHIGWDKGNDTKLDKSMIVTAQYKETIINNPNPSDPVPEGYVRVSFNPTDKGTIVSGTAVQDVLIAAKKTLGELSKPAVQGIGTNVFSGWDTKDDTKLDESIKDRALTVTALYNDDIKPVDNPDSDIPKGYARVVFKAGDHGKFEQGETTAYDVLMKKDVKRTLGEVKKPKVKANDGYTFKAWDKADTTELVVNAKTEVTATYNQNVIISDDPDSEIPEGYVRAIFKTDAKGSMKVTINGVEKTNLETVVMDVLPKTKTVEELKKNITLTAKDSNVFEGWSKPDDYLVANNVTIEAQYQGGQTNTPSATALNVKDNPFTTITGKAEPGATVIAKVDGVEVGKATAKDDGTYTIEAKKDGNRLPDRTKVNVTATKAPQSESKPQTAIVLPDANGDGIPDGDLQAPSMPVVKQPYDGDTSIKMNIPKEDDANKIVVEVKYADDKLVSTVEVVKNGDTWKVGNETVTVDTDTNKMTIPLPKNTVLAKDQKVIVRVIDTSNNKSEPAIKEVKDKEQLAKPEINTPKQGDETVSGKAPGAETVDVIITNKDGSEAEKKTGQKVNDDGSFTVPVNELKDGQKVTVVAKAEDKKPSEASKKVGLELDKIKETKKEADGVVDKATKDGNWKPEGPDANPFDKNLKDKMDKADKVIKAAEDDDDNNDPTQGAINDAEKELRDALNKKDADTKVTDVEDKVKKGEKPSAEDIKAAQDAIDKIEGSTDPNAKDFDKDKKDLQDRLDKAKLIDELKDKVDNAPKDDKDHPEYKTKPDDVKKELERAKEEAEKVIEDYKKPDDQKDPNVKTPEKAKEDLDKAIDNYNKERVIVSVAIPSAEFNSLSISSLQSNVKIIVKIDGIEQEFAEDLYTSPEGKLVVTLEKALTKDQKVEIIGSKPGLLDGGASIVTP